MLRIITLNIIFLIGCSNSINEKIDNAYKANLKHDDKTAYLIMSGISIEEIAKHDEINFLLSCIVNYKEESNDEQLDVINQLLDKKIGKTDLLLFKKASILAIQSTRFKENKYLVTDSRKHEVARGLLLNPLKLYPDVIEHNHREQYVIHPNDEFPLLDHLLKPE